MEGGKYSVINYEAGINSMFRENSREWTDSDRWL